MDNLEIYDKVRAVPDNAKKPIQGGRLNGKTDINPMWRIKTLTEMFGPCGVGWYYETTKQWTEQYGEEIAAFVNISLYVKYSGEWSKPIFGVGGSMFAEKERSGIHVSDECFKMATTDAISVACKQLGIGADVYWEADKTKYDMTEQNESVKMTAKTQKDEETVKLFKELEGELIRTGYGCTAVLKKYKVDSLEQMTKLQLKDCIFKMKSVPDKESA